MAVSLFSGVESSKQAQLARQEKDKAAGWGAKGQTEKASMSADQASAFQNSSFMKKAAEIEKIFAETMASRNKMLQQTDRTWLPSPSDLKAPKSFNFDKFMNYYGVLGVGDVAAQDEIKQAYKRLSLVYHPDKTTGMEKKERDRYADIFIELKNAYLVLTDNPTRHQYDAERIREKIMCDSESRKMKTREQFYGYEKREEQMMHVIEKVKGPGITLDLPLTVRLEKFVFGGNKKVNRNKKMFKRGEWIDRMMTFNIEVPTGAAEPIEKMFFGKGDEHENALPDNLKYSITSEPNDFVERQGMDLVTKKPVTMCAKSDQYYSYEFPSIQGRHIVLWGRNPFFKSPGTGEELLQFELIGQGLGGGSLLCNSALGQDNLVPGEQLWEIVGGADKGGILVRMGKETSAAKAADRLSTGALVRKIELDGDRLNYQLISGTGPPAGWVAVSLGKKSLAQPSDAVKTWEVIGGGDEGLTVKKTKSATSSVAPEKLKKGALLKQVDIDGERIKFEKLSGDGPAAGWIPIRGGGGGDAKASADPADGSSCPPAMLRRLQRQLPKTKIGKVRIGPIGSPIALYTKPSCTIEFYSNLHLPAATEPGFVRQRPAFAVVLTSQGCSKTKSKKDWDTLKNALVPVLQASAWMLLRGSRGILPKPLANSPTRAEQEPAKDTESVPEPWERLGDEAAAREDNWLSASLYSKCLAADPQDDIAARLLTKRSSCFAKVKDHAGALEDAQRATELTPDAASSWSLVGSSYQQGDSSPESLKEAIKAYTKAVELGQSTADMDALFAVTQRLGDNITIEGAIEEKVQGNACMEKGEYNNALALYTVAMARMPPSWSSIETTNDVNPAALMSQLYSNRSTAFVRLQNWAAAIADAQKAVGIKKDSPKAHTRLGVALLGSGAVEKAYDEFAWALKLDDSNPMAWNCRNAALMQMSRCCSLVSQSRRGRFFMDAKRPKGSSRVFAVSDLHFDYKYNQEWAHMIDDVKFKEDVLIVSGGMADSGRATFDGLAALRRKFRRVFYTIGCHDLYIVPQEKGTYPDSISKMQAILAECDRLGVDVVPAPISEDVFIVPLFSWYNAAFDEKDPHLDDRVHFDMPCEWPIDKDDQVWKFMLQLNVPHLDLPYHGTVISASHCLPRRGLPFWGHIGTQAKSVGCVDIDEQVRKVNSKACVYGRSHRRYSKEHDGVLYCNMPLGLKDERMEEIPPLMLIYDGQKVCGCEWDIDDTRVEDQTLTRLENAGKNILSSGGYPGMK